MTWWERFGKWIADAWNADARASREPTISAHTAHREHEAHLHELADRVRTVHPPALTGNATQLLEPDYDRDTEPLPRPPPLPRESRK